jgi:hypothetical protein
MQVTVFPTREFLNVGSFVNVTRVAALTLIEDPKEAVNDDCTVAVPLAVDEPPER